MTEHSMNDLLRAGFRSKFDAPVTSESLREAAKGGEEGSALPPEEEPKHSMNELLRAAVHGDAEGALDRIRASSPSGDGPVTGSADGGVRGTTTDVPPPFGKVLGAAVADAFWSRRYDRPRASTVEELKYTGRLDDRE